MLVLHDNDMLVPQDYACQLLARSKEGYEVINLKRFIFYLAEAHAANVVSKKGSISAEPPESIVQNLEAGGSVGITRDSFLAIGGFDESFIGWGGEDNEFWQRAQTRRVWPYGYLPIVHLWHAPQPGKLEQERHTAELFEARSAIPVVERITTLIAHNFGSRNGFNPASRNSKTAVDEDSKLPV